MSVNGATGISKRVACRFCKATTPTWPLSYAERTNVYFMPVAIVIVVAIAQKLSRNPAPLAVL